MAWHKGRRLLAAGLLLAAGGCTVGPDYREPETRVAKGFAEIEPVSAQEGAPGSRTTAGPARVARWWTVFKDRELDTLIDRAATGNLDVQRAASRIAEARLQRVIAGADLLPEVDAAGSFQHIHTSGSLAAPIPPSLPSATASSGGTGAPSAGTPAFGQGAPGSGFDLYQAGFDASWEIDIFGRVRRGVEAVDDQAQAAVEDSRDVLVSLLAEVARTYIDLRATQRRTAIARENLARQQETLRLTRARFEHGFTTELDVARQDSQAAATAAEIPLLEAEQRADMHALGVLLGDGPDALLTELSAPAAIPPVPPEVPVGMPSDLLRRRPDIRRAERQLAAQTAEIGAATADLFPRFSLTGSFAFESPQAKNLFDWKSRTFIINPSVTWPLFDAGRIRANIQVQNALQEQALLSYRSAVLGALRDVEDALVRYGREQERRASLAHAVTAARRSVTLARDQYQKGLSTLIDVIDAQRALLAQEDALTQSDQAISADLVALYKALGGGWEAAPAQQNAAESGPAGKPKMAKAHSW